MSGATWVLLAQLAFPGAAAPPRHVTPVLSLPEPGLDDSAAYQGYQTRFFRDAAGNTLQIYLNERDGRVVHLWADAENESLGFTARDGRGSPAPLRWNADGAEVATAGRARSVEHHLAAGVPVLHLGWFLLGSMRVERDFQYAGRQRSSFAQGSYSIAEIERLLAALDRLPPAIRRRHLAALGATDVATLRERVRPRVIVVPGEGGNVTLARVIQPSLDGRDTLTLELSANALQVALGSEGDSLTLRARTGGTVAFAVRVTTTGRPLAPLARREIFTPEFLTFLAQARAEGGTRGRWLERQVRGVELLSSREKLLAGLPTYATYFGRDMLMTALMMRPIWKGAMAEAVIGSVLRKLAADGEVSHEEALGGQAVREAAAEYASLVDGYADAARRGDRAAADRQLALAYGVLRQARRVRENYHMIDAGYQLPVLVARWLEDPRVPNAHKRAFLLDSSGGSGRRLARLVRELALVARNTAAYAREPGVANLISFARRDTGWASASWRDSGAGYAGGRYPMDVNAIWVPHALASIGHILAALPALGLNLEALGRSMPELASGTPLGAYARDSLALNAAVDAWSGAAKLFTVRLDATEARSRVQARLATMPPAEREYWTARLPAALGTDSVVFSAVALDAAGKPIGVANTDPATQLFLGEVKRGRPDPAASRRALEGIRLFARAYPIGLLIDRVGPVVANDAYASPGVWAAFARDPYHGPRVVWGREVNLFLLGVAHRLAETSAGGTGVPWVGELRAALERVRGAVEASGFRSELWSYDFVDGRPTAVRYGSGSDVQLWSTTDLAVQFALSRLGR